MTIDQVKTMAERLPWGRPDEAIAKIIDEAEHCGSNTVVVSLNRGVMPAEMTSPQDVDAWLRARRLNPGTTADLTAASLFVALREGIIKLPLAR